MNYFCRKTTSSAGNRQKAVAGGGSSSAGMWRFYTEDSPGIKVYVYNSLNFATFPCPLMKRMFKQGWSTIPPISTNQTISSHLKLNELKIKLLRLTSDIQKRLLCMISEIQILA
jgi:hypothetical protein